MRYVYGILKVQPEDLADSLDTGLPEREGVTVILIYAVEKMDLLSPHMGGSDTQKIEGH